MSISWIPRLGRSNTGPIPLSAFLLALGSFYTPRCVAQTAQQFMDAACANEIRQQSSLTLWESTSERRSGGHVYRDRTIETADGDVDQLVSVDGHAPDGPEKSKNDKVLEGLLHNAKTRADMHTSFVNENKDAATLMRVLPKMFLLEDKGERDGMEVIAFRPNPAFQPQTYEQRGIHAMAGTFTIEKSGMRLTGIDAEVSEPVQFGYGLLGTLEQGGTYTLNRVEVGPGVWKTESMKMHLSGRVALFKNINKQQEESKSGWRALPSGTTIEQALVIFGMRP